MTPVWALLPLFALSLAQAVVAADLHPSPELMDFLGRYQDKNDKWIDPTELDLEIAMPIKDEKLNIPHERSNEDKQN